MAWSISLPRSGYGYVDATSQINGWLTLTITEIASTTAGKIRLRVNYTVDDAWSYHVDYYGGNLVLKNGSSSVTVGYVPHNNGSGTLYVDVDNSWSGATLTMELLSYNQSFTLGARKTYALSISAGANIAVMVNRTASAVGSTGGLSSGAVLYTGDTLTVSATVPAGYAIDTLTVNGSAINSGAAVTVSAAVVIVASAKVMGAVWIDNGSGFEMYLIYIDNGSAWEQVAPYIDNGSGWEVLA